MNQRDAEILGLIGPKKCGKTWRGLQMIKPEKLVIFVDTAREFGGGKIKIVHRPDHLIELMRNHDRRSKLHISFRAAEHMDPQRAFDYAAAIAMADPNERCLLFANETGRLIPYPGKMSKVTYKLVTMNRHFNVPIIWTAQKITGVHPELRGNSDFVDIFRTHEHNALGHIKKMGGPDALKSFQALEKYEFLRFAPDAPWKKCKKTKKT